MEIAAISRQGRRDSNDDVVFAASGLVVLADGMGGHAGGRQAATAAVGAALQQLTSASDSSVRDAFTAANAAVRAYRLTRPEHADAGCTLTVIAVRQNPAIGTQAIVAHAGDSPAFLVRNGEMTLLTPPHTVAEHLRRDGRITEEQAATHPGRHTLQRSIGATSEVVPELQAVELQDGDRLMICSDGLLDVPDRRRLRDILLDGGSATDLARRLLDVAMESSSDNVTVAVIVDPTDATNEGAVATDR